MALLSLRLLLVFAFLSNRQNLVAACTSCVTLSLLLLSLVVSFPRIGIRCFFLLFLLGDCWDLVLTTLLIIDCFDVFSLELTLRAHVENELLLAVLVRLNLTRVDLAIFIDKPLLGELSPQLLYHLLRE